MKNILLSTLFIFSLTACERDLGTNQDDLASVELIFKATYNGEPFVANEELDYGDHKIRIQNFSFFVSDVRVGSAASSEEVEDIEFLDFSTINTAQQANDGFMIAQSSVPANNYSGVALGLGVQADYNSETPAEFGPYHPLSETSRYWADWNSYIFLKIEGLMDTDDDGQYDDVSFVYHIGGDEAYRSVEIDQPLTIDTDNPMQVTATVDIYKILTNDQEMHDIEAKPSLHNAGDPLAGFLMGNFRNAITIE